MCMDLASPSNHLLPVTGSEDGMPRGQMAWGEGHGRVTQRQAAPDPLVTRQQEGHLPPDHS